ncbi:MAG TPA: hypothetical protein VFS00_04105, partial [Polyangiaceae bacterium]|nr:hypothetical protein [Polyangiaceae bacterium]
EASASDLTKTPASLRSVAKRFTPERERTTTIVAFLLGVLTISALAALLSRLGSKHEDQDNAAKPPAVTQGQGPNQLPSAPSASAAPAAPSVVAPAPSPAALPSADPPTPSASSPPPPAPSAGAKGAPTRPRSSGAGKAHPTGRGSTDRENEERMREVLCRQKGTCE